MGEHTSPAPIRWGVVGLGDVAEKKGGPALYRAHGSTLAAVMSRDLDKARAFATRHGAIFANDGIRAYDSLENLLKDTAVDAIYIATPPFLHCEQAIACARAGKHVLVEKPMAMNGAECDAMIAAAHTSGTHLHVAYYRRFWPRPIAVKTLITDGAIGTILGVRLQMCAKSGTDSWRVRPDVAGGGHFVDVGSHRLDMIQYLCGEIVSAVGFSDNQLALHEAENDVVLALRFANRAIGSASFHFHTLPPKDAMEIYGSDGTIVCDPFDGADIVVRRGADAPVILSFSNPSPSHLPFVEALVDVYRNAPHAVAHVTGEVGARTTKLMETVLTSRPVP